MFSLGFSLVFIGHPTPQLFGLDRSFIHRYNTCERRHLCKKGHATFPLWGNEKFSKVHVPLLAWFPWKATDQHFHRKRSLFRGKLSSKARNDKVQSNYDQIPWLCHSFRIQTTSLFICLKAVLSCSEMERSIISLSWNTEDKRWRNRRKETFHKQPSHTAAQQELCITFSTQCPLIRSGSFAFMH